MFPTVNLCRFEYNIDRLDRCINYEVDDVKPRGRHVSIVVVVVVVDAAAADAVVAVIIIINIIVITDLNAVVDRIFLAVYVQFRFADIDTFATNLWFALHYSLQTYSHFHYGTHRDCRAITVV